jgi:hypothetical protein
VDLNRVMPEGTEVLPDGTKVLPDGTVVYPDGTVQYPDGTVVAPGDIPGNRPDADRLQVVDSFADLPASDPYSLERVDIDGDFLRLAVSYSGGCEAHDFALWTTKAYGESLPPVHGLVLTHDAHGDLCEAWITRELRFDLSPLKAIHQADQDRIIVRIGSPIDSAGHRIEYVF